MYYLQCLKKVFFNNGILLTGIITFCNPFSAAYAENLWGFCNDTNHLAYADFFSTTRKPEADKICKLPVAESTGEASVVKDLNRCKNSQASTCNADSLSHLKKDLGIVIEPDGFGDNDVPWLAWYIQSSSSTQYPKIRCSCGCFTPNTYLLTNSGWEKIDNLRVQAMEGKDNKLLILDKNGHSLKSSADLKPGFFTKGPEEKPVIRIQTANNYAVEMTEKHPVLIKSGKSTDMVQANTLKVGDIVFDTQGNPQKITSITTRMLDKNDNNVYNVNTNGFGDNEHIIVANGLRVGDLAWQNKLAERAQRIGHLVSSN